MTREQKREALRGTALPLPNPVPFSKPKKLSTLSIKPAKIFLYRIAPI